MSRFYDLQNCSDFSSAIPNQQQSLYQIAAKYADDLGLMHDDFNKFSQGFVHASRGDQNNYYYDDMYTLGFNTALNNNS